MQDRPTRRVLTLIPPDEDDATEDDKAMERAHAVAETRKLRVLLKDGKISHECYSTHLRAMTQLMVGIFSDEPPTAPKRIVKSDPPPRRSGARLRSTTLDEILISYLVGEEVPARNRSGDSVWRAGLDEEEPAGKRLLGGW